MVVHAFVRRAKAIALVMIASLALALSGGETALACACEAITPVEGFDRAEYVLSGKVVEATAHTWVVDVDRVWKGADKLADRVKLLDVYAEMDCEFFFALDQDYLFFAIMGKSSRYVWYQPSVPVTRPGEFNGSRAAMRQLTWWISPIP